MTDEKYTAKELEEMANALLAQDKSADKAKSAKPAVKAEKAAENPEKADDGKHPVASRGKLDEKAIAALPAAALLNANEKLKDLFVKGKKKGRLDAGELSDVLDDQFPIVICSKGVEAESGYLPVGVFESELGNRDRLAVLSGPNHAEEVIKAKPAGTVIASSGQDTAVMFRDLFASPTFRTYTSDDVTGVELCAAFKNVIAIAVGVAYGLGYGDNTAAMLMTRGLAEMSRLTVKCGGQAITCMGLAGAGDLIATCTSEHSRNRSFGVELAQGGTLDGYRERTHMVVEGALACKTLKTLSDAYDVELPITDVVRSVVWEGADPKAAAKDLFARPLTTEFYGL